MRNTLLASVSHDFRTPLSSILGSATSLIDYGDKLDAPPKKTCLGRSRQEAEDLDEMVRNLLAITRIDAGALELRRDWIDLRKSSNAWSAPRGVTARATDRNRIAERSALVQADATLVEQAIGNVVANAIVHTPTETRVVIDAGNVRRMPLRCASPIMGPGFPRTICRISSRSSSKGRSCRY